MVFTLHVSYSALSIACLMASTFRCLFPYLQSIFIPDLVARGLKGLSDISNLSSSERIHCTEYIVLQPNASELASYATAPFDLLCHRTSDTLQRWAGYMEIARPLRPTHAPLPNELGLFDSRSICEPAWPPLSSILTQHAS